ncbi:MAG TPA: S-methyl-5'-thioadenosine phosphorylase [Candidatus Polarisedimenticolia bacterium]|jgi:5'-methylthioadenosine phosphorylase|nr:S-methyl-5'-thioadenosine phosphorylase [Candidatus Polarisedimenticolia bacterium]
MSALGVIGGSGLYQMAGLVDRREERVRTPFGDPSDAYVLGRLAGRDIAFLARHGRGHRLLPSEINFRANMYGFKAIGASRIVSVSAVGSLKEDIRPLDVVLPDQFIDWTRQRISTFFGGGIVAHVSLADPICGALHGFLSEAAGACGARVRRGGTYLCIEGPQFSTRAESHLYRLFQADVIGMTNVQEAKLAREAEICYATMAMVTDYDCWRPESVPVTVEEVVARLKDNADMAASILAHAAPRLPEARACPCADALKNAILTDPAAIPRESRERLRLLVGKYLD